MSITNSFFNNINPNKKSNFYNIKKYNIILDIDECIVNSQNFVNAANTDIYITRGPHRFIKFSTGKNLDKIQYITFLRPGLEVFLRFLFKNYNVGIWTTGTTTYAKALIKELFKNELELEEEYKNLICFFTRVEDDNDDLYLTNETIIRKYKSYDLITKKTFLNTSNGVPVKDLNILFNNKYFKNKNILPSNTILIDDNFIHNGINNGSNVISVRMFNYLFTCDTLLQKLEKYLTSLLLKKNKLIKIHTIKLKQFVDIKDNIYNEYIKNPKLDYIKKVEKYCNSKSKTNKSKTSKSKISKSKTSKSKISKSKISKSKISKSEISKSKTSKSKSSKTKKKKS